MSFGTRRARRADNQALLVVIVSAIVLSGLSAVVVGATAYGAAQRFVDALPNLDTPPPPFEQTTKVFARDGTLLANLFFAEDRIPVSIGKLPRVLINAVIATEDRRFFTHRGVDFESIGRALVADIRSGKVVEGGSTITQQYVKNLYGERQRTVQRKIREALLAYQFEQRYPKTRILERYLNTIYLGQSAYGVEAASRMYFGKSARRVTLPEAALLAGLIRSPNTSSPYLSLSRAKARRDRVLDQMLEQRMVTTAQATAAKRLPLRVLAPHAPKGRAPYFTEYAKQTLIRQYGADRVFKGGLRVTTTLDLKMQAAAERAAWGTLDRPDDPAVALVAIEPASGAIRAMVGGKEFRLLRYNLATQGHRQPGSAFKPFVLATALSQGYSLGTMIESSPGYFDLPDGGHWSVSNATEGGGGGLMSLHDATVHSVNAVFARIMMDVGPEAVAGTAERMGITTELNRDPAIALGGLTRGVTTLEMASAYGTLANRGFRVEPTPIEQIRNAYGSLVAKSQPEGEAVLDQGVSALVTQALEDVVRDGTGHRAQIGRPVAGKTGTTQDYRDAWFVGYTPQLVTAVWVGYPTREKAMYDVHGRRVAGGTFPAMIWAEFMSDVLAGAPPKAFAGPPKGSMVKVQICSQTNLLVTQYCPQPVTASFLVGQEPKELCDVHVAPAARAIPRVLGMDIGRASAVLATNGFVAVTTWALSPKPSGTVIAQSPDAGRIARYGTAVSLTVSGGKNPPTQNSPPRAAFTVSNPTPKVDESVLLDATGSTDLEGNLSRWVWSLGDGASGTGPRITHKYRTAGTYTVALTVYDRAGGATSIARTLLVRP